MKVERPKGGQAITKPIGFFRSLLFSFLADTVSRNRTFARHVGLPLAEGGDGQRQPKKMRRLFFSHPPKSKGLAATMSTGMRPEL